MGNEEMGKLNGEMRKWKRGNVYRIFCVQQPAGGTTLLFTLTVFSWFDSHDVPCREFD